jgi:SAM-dependent methyltransferase
MSPAARAYSSGYYSGIETDSWRSSREVAPLIADLVHPSTAVDVGCGSGSWAKALKDAGATTILGIDGSFVRDDQLVIEPAEFMRADLEQPLQLARTFDVALSLEVAEHLLPARAEGFVDDLCRLSAVVVFSAAAPGQGGRHHINEQWPSYWAALFARRGYEVFDAIRPRIWDNELVAWWFRQNMLIFVRRDVVATLPWTAALAAPPRPLDVIHPRAYEEATMPARMSPRMLQVVARALPTFPAKIYRRLIEPGLRRYLGSTTSNARSSG